jgi:hypothetical protein
VRSVAFERLAEAAAESRERYLRHYRRVLDLEQAEHAPVVAEILVRLGEGSSELLRSLQRLDAIWGNATDPHPLEIQDTPVSTDSASFTEATLVTVVGYPFVWHACEFVWPSPLELGPLFEQWYERWMDLNELLLAGSDGLSGVVHSVTVPGARCGGWGIDVDFGSAPVESMLELLSLPVVVDAGAVKVGSFSFR